MNLDDETFSENSEIDDNLIHGTPQPDKNDLMFYREMNNKFQNQTKNPQQAIFEQDYSLCEADDQQPELYDPVSRNLVVFDKFDDSEKYVDRLKRP